MTRLEPGPGDIAEAKAVGFEVHYGDATSSPELQGKWWWTLHQDSWSGVETSDQEFDSEAAAWADAVEHLAWDAALRRAGVCAS